MIQVPQEWPQTCSREAESPWTTVFQKLREILCDTGAWTNARLAREALDCEPKQVTVWADPNGRLREKGEHRVPPMWAIRRLAALADMAIVVLPQEIRLVPIAQACA